jgi:hypothetical protein
MNISDQSNNQNYSLSSGSGSRKDVLNYSNADYNNYQSWSNVSGSHIHISAVDENNQVTKNKFGHNRLQPLGAPFMSFGDTSLSWAPVNSEHVKPNDKYLQKN